MTISSIASSSAQLAQLSSLKTNEKVEGNKPDGDGDQDDLSTSVTGQGTTGIGVTGNIGLNINTVA